MGRGAFRYLARFSMRTLLLPALLAGSIAQAQTLTPTLLTPIDHTLNETSGLLVLNGHVWTQLDSGNPNDLYEIDPANGSILRTVSVTNAPDQDWEDIAADGQWLYIGDFGNNAGARTDLRVFRVPLETLLEEDVTHVEADTIRFSYAEQTDFTPADHANNWDCEALVAMDDSLFLFWKNWLTQDSYLYAIAATPGDHIAARRDTLAAQGLITGATYDPGTQAIALCGYSPTLMPFVWWLHGYQGHAFFDGAAERHALQLPLTQVEGIAWSAPGEVYLSNEHNSLSAARLWRLEIGTVTGIAAATARTEDMPVLRGSIIELNTATDRPYTITDSSGRLLWSGRSSGRRIQLRNMGCGAYLLHWTTDEGERRTWRFARGS